MKADNPTKIEGYAAVFNSPTKIADASGRTFTEIIRPKAFRKALDANPDIRALYNHDTNLILGRTKSGTLKLWEDDKGLFFSLDIPDTQAGRDLKVSVERRDIDGCSFAFVPLKDRWGEKDGAPVRELLELELIEISPCVFPAYQRTSLDLRTARPNLSQYRLQLLRMELAEKI